MSNDITLGGILLDGEVVCDDNGELSLSCPVCLEPVVTVESGDGIGGVLELYVRHTAECTADDLSEITVWLDGNARHHAKMPVNFSVDDQERKVRRARKAIARSKNVPVAQVKVELFRSEVDPPNGEWARGTVTFREVQR